MAYALEIGWMGLLLMLVVRGERVKGIRWACEVIWA